MPNYDLSTATMGLVANQSVDTLRIANQDIWTSAAAPTYTIFDNQPLDVTSYSDSFTGSWEAMQLEKYSGSDLEILAVGVYVPSGATIIGVTGQVGVKFNTIPFSGASTYPNDISGGALASAGPLAVGWNWCNFTSPLLWQDANPNILVACGFNQYYLFSNTVTSSPVASTGSNFEMVTTGRSWYTSSPGTFSNTSARSYGLDILVRDA